MEIQDFNASSKTCKRHFKTDDLCTWRHQEQAHIDDGRGTESMQLNIQLQVGQVDVDTKVADRP